MLAADLDALVKPPGLYIGIIAVIIIAAVGHRETDAADCRNRWGSAQSRPDGFQLITVGNQGDIFDLYTVSSAQVDAPYRMLIVG